MKTLSKIMFSMLLISFMGSGFSTQAGLWDYALGTAQWEPTVLTFPCSSGSMTSGSIGGSVGPGGGSAEISGSHGSGAVYSQFEGERKFCEGLWGICSNEGATRVTNMIPISPCVQ
jgi:hypothetical protein